MQYTDSQAQAIATLDQNLQIIACAGSGKTQVISARIVELLANGAQPSEIVAFTFTEKAAGELQDRIDRLCKERLGHNIGLGEMFVGTIHGYCLNLLQSPPLYRYLKYTVLNDVQQRLLIDRNSTKSGLTRTPLLSGSGNLSRWKDSKLYQSLISIMSEGDVDMEQVPVAVQEAVTNYQLLLHDHNRLDYTMIISEAVHELTSNQQLREQVASTLRHVVVDEYQDVNPLQERLICLLYELGALLCVVGDDDQTIYQWRGSDVSNIITFAERYPDVKQIRLNENFRSSSAVIEAAREVVQRNPERLAKRMESVEAQSADFGDLLALDLPDPEGEGEWIAEKIIALYGTPYRDRPAHTPRGLSYSDFAILLRSVTRDAGPIVAALDAADIPYVVSGMNGLFDTPEVDAMCQIYYHMAGFAPRSQQPPSEMAVRQALNDAGFGRTPAQLDAGIAFIRRRKREIGSRSSRTLQLQRVYLDLLEMLEMREENLPQTTGRTPEIIFYNLGKFSQVITDFEQIYYRSSPEQLYNQFSNFLFYQAADYYPEGWEEAGYAQIDAVQIMTVHKAKGMQWPAVFVPALRRNRFPSRRQGGRQVWHVIPETAVPNVDRYKGTVEDERRLFYVALTRAEKYLFCTYAPIVSNTQQRKRSDFMAEVTAASAYMLTHESPQFGSPPKLPAQPRREEQPVVLSFSELKYFFECPYSFKLRFLYGFDNPVDPALGYGRALHNALAEVHAEAIQNNIYGPADVPTLWQEHLFLPFATPDVQLYLEKTGAEALTNYLVQHQRDLMQIEHVEKPIELKLGEGIVVNGRIDLIRRVGSDDWAIVDFKSTQRAQQEDTTLKQLQVYALGYEQLTGKQAKLIEVHNLDDGGVDRSLVNKILIEQMVQETVAAGHGIRENELPRLNKWCNTCARCDFAGICRTQRNGSKV